MEDATNMFCNQNIHN